jgi:hypothetical protein
MLKFKDRCLPFKLRVKERVAFLEITATPHGLYSILQVYLPISMYERLGRFILEEENRLTIVGFNPRACCHVTLIG